MGAVCGQQNKHRNSPPVPDRSDAEAVSKSEGISNYAPDKQPFAPDGGHPELKSEITCEWNKPGNKEEAAVEPGSTQDAKIVPEISGQPLLKSENFIGSQLMKPVDCSLISVNCQVFGLLNGNRE